MFGCHCIDSRSFHIRGKRLPLCARCTGELLGIVLGLVLFPFFPPSVPLSLALMLPMVLDGGIQLLTPYESGNFRRVITGALFGYALASLFLASTAAVFHLGLALGERLAG